MSLDDLVDALREAIRIGESFELAMLLDPARETLSNAVDRRGFPGETFVLALVGGTGVGKSTLLNAMAGTEVSAASVIRPTTDRPRAWVGGDGGAELSSLLEWIGVEQTVDHPAGPLDGVVIVDMPDFDSIVAEHRLTVDRLLPRIDSILWVVDPEKYDDERLYEYLRSIGARADAFSIVLNKIDRLGQEEREAVSRDLMRRLVEAGIQGATLHLVSATQGEGVGELIEVLRKRAEAKREVYAKIRSEVRASVGQIAGSVGLPVAEPGSGLKPGALDQYRDSAVSAAIDVVDLPGVGRQVASAYLEKAAARAGSLVGRLGALGRLVFGIRRRQADPVRYIRDWRSRGDVSRAVIALRQAYLETTSEIPVSGRAGMLNRLDPDAAAESLTTALDSALSESAGQLDIRPPLLWRVLSFLQLIATVGLLAAVAWYVMIWIAPAGIPVGTIELPELGPVPVPLALLVASAALSLLIGATVRIHATWLGRRQARRVMANVRARVSESVDQHGFAPIARLRNDMDRLSELVELVSAP